MKRSIWIANIVLCMAASVAAAQSETVLIRDQFNRGTAAAPVPLNGTAVSESAGGRIVWAAQDWVTNGTAAVITDARSKSAFVRFKPEQGHVYELSAKITIENPMQYENSWIGLAFSQAANPGLQLFAQGMGSNGVFIRDNNGVQAVFEKRGTSLIAAGDGDPLLITLTLDTRQEAWSMGWKVNGTEYGTRTFSEKPVINFIGFGNFTTAKGQVEEFTLRRLQ